MGCPIGQNSLFGAASNYIKFQGGDLIAIEGANTVERQMLSDLRFNYKQLLRGRVILKPGQVNYLMNHLGLGDNATFVSIAARYDAKSKIEEDNYVNWSFYDDLTKIYPMCQYMCLTGNSTNRVKQLYLTNPNPDYAVTLDVMVAVLDDSYNFYNDTVNQSATSFVNLRYTDLKSYVIGESVMFIDANSKPLIYIILNNINAIEITDNILIIDDNAFGRLFFQFVSQYDASQANSILNYVLDNPNTDISTLGADTTLPILYWYSNVNNSATASIITLGGEVDGRPYNTSNGLTFSTLISLLEFGGASMSLTKDYLIDLLVDKVVDNRDGTMSIAAQNIKITGTQGDISQITVPGDYTLSLNLSDIAGNSLSGVKMNLNIIDSDTRRPVVYWNKFVDNDILQPYITFLGATSGAPYTSEVGNTFSTSLVFPTYQFGGEITKSQLIDLMIDKVIDYNDGEIDVFDSHIILLDESDVDQASIFATGSYRMTFNIEDIAQNSLYGVYLNMNVVDQLPDTNAPVVYFYTNVNQQLGEPLINLIGGINPYGFPLDTSTLNTFETSFTFSVYATQSILSPNPIIDKTNLINILIDYVLDDTDGPISIVPEDIKLVTVVDGLEVDYVGTPGTYTLSFNLTDSLGNSIQNKALYLYILGDTIPE